MAPKRFLTGSTTFSILSASMVSARMLPMMNAPKALEKPTFVLTTAIRQHSPRETMRRVSAFISFLTLRRNIGTAKMPTTSHRTRKNPILSTDPIICSPSGDLPLATALSITIMTMARISSRMSTLITMPENFCWRSPRSSKAL